MLLLIAKYRMYYWKSHYHHLRMNALVSIQAKKSSSMNDGQLKKSVRKFIAHAKRFDELQLQLDMLKEQICSKYPDFKENEEES